MDDLAPPTPLRSSLVGFTHLDPLPVSVLGAKLSPFGVLLFPDMLLGVWDTIRSPDWRLATSMLFKVAIYSTLALLTIPVYLSRYGSL